MSLEGSASTSFLAAECNSDGVDNALSSARGVAPFADIRTKRCLASLFARSPSPEHLCRHRALIDPTTQQEDTTRLKSIESAHCVGPNGSPAMIADASSEHHIEAAKPTYQSLALRDLVKTKVHCKKCLERSRDPRGQPGAGRKACNRIKDRTGEKTTSI